MRRLGIDIGSLSFSSALVENGRVIDTTYAPHQGEVAQLCATVLAKHKKQGFDFVGISSGILANRKNIIDPTLAVIEGSRFLSPASPNVLSIGSERYFLVFFDGTGRYREHIENPPCASGTGSFLEQQALRLELSCQQLALRAAAFTGKTPEIATRCAVFAKSDIIHAMQDGYCVDAIAAGLCRGIGRSVLDVLLKGRTLVSPLALVGGVALNLKIVDSIHEMTGIEVLVPEHAVVAGAIGAALLSREKTVDVDELFRREKKIMPVRPKLRLSLSRYPDWNQYDFTHDGRVEIFTEKNGKVAPGPVAVGFDIGSTSTKSVVIDKKGTILKGFYTRTGGEPIAAVQELVRVMKKSLNNLPELSAVGTTGSGRKMIKELFGADLEVNEITAHATAARRIHPDVDTIIEIGGQDSKLTLLSNGDVSSAEMNYVCAAGTGSFIDEQAKRLGVSLDEMSSLAEAGEAPFTSDRCTVYMERDLAVLLGEGWSKKSLAAAVLFSVRDNYLSKVVHRTPLGNHIVFQGATARNRALVAAFEQALGRPITVSPYCHLTGAYGAALLAADGTSGRSAFLAYELAISFRNETCTLCANRCSLLVAEQGERVTGWGMKCGREYEERGHVNEIKTDVEERFDAFRCSLEQLPRKHARNGTTIALLDGLYNREYNPLWRLFLSSLGFSVITVDTSKEILLKGKQCVNSDFCTPMIMAHGLAREALAGKAAAIFFPAFMNEREGGAKPGFFRTKIRDCYFCYYSQYLPTVLENLTACDFKDKLISPLIQLYDKTDEQVAVALCTELERLFPDLTLDETTEAFKSAHSAFIKAREGFRKKLAPPAFGKIRVVLLGRPYAVFDPVISLSIPAQLENLGVEVYWQDEIDTDDLPPSFSLKYYERMHWKYGREILAALEYCAATPGTFPVFLSCFRCSPDSFLLSYAKEMMVACGKPFLFLTLDELASSVGYTTRIEAAMHAFKNHAAGQRKKTAALKKRPLAHDALAKGDTVLIPYLNKLISSFWVECFNNAGFQGILLDTGEKELATGYAYANGGECMPAVAIAGGMIEKVKALSLDPEKTMLYIPTCCMACNFPQFPIFARLAAAEAGLSGLKVALINSMLQGDALPGNLSMKLFEAGVSASLIYKFYFRTRPYEKETGATDQALQKAGLIMSRAFGEGSDARTAMMEVAEIFRLVDIDRSRPKPRIAILGDFYVKYNEAVNRNLQELVIRLGGELVIPSFTEMAFHFFDVDVRLFGDEPRHMKILSMFEKRYEKMARDLLGGDPEPEWAECVKALLDYGIHHYIPGETSLNTARALYYLSKKSVDAVVHINPMFCCPGVVSSSLFKKISREFGVPIVDIFYDGTGDPNRVLVPHLHYLNAKS